MPVDRRIRCERTVLVVAHGRHAYGMVHATTGREGLPGRIGAAVRTDSCGMVDLGIRTFGTRHTTPDQQSREENWQTFGGRVVQRDEHGVSVPWMFFSWSPVHPSTARRDPKEHRLPTVLCQCRRAMGMRVERNEKRSGREKVSGCCISATTTRTMDNDVATDPERRAYRNRVRSDRV